MADSLQKKYKSVDYLIRRIQSYFHLNARVTIEIINQELPYILKEHDEMLIRDIQKLLENVDG